MTKEYDEIEILKIEEKDIIAVENETTTHLTSRGDDRRTLGKVLIGAGAALLFVNLLGLFTGFSLGQFLWPLWFVIPGALMLWPARNMEPGDNQTWAWLAIPGAVLLTLGGMFFFMNMFDHFEAWAYAWPLLPISVLWALLYINRYSNDEDMKHGLRSAIRVLFWIMAGLGAFFELLIFNNVLGVLWPVLLIGGGIYLIAKHRRQTLPAA
ncbi:MAG: hypothetical protein M9928_03885 [Anaerolineae bacterium]|nr:hypothetical protein [Anaerolineae bacterium]MCO5204145.1 hypothetical protein [Anaerolineae bacterium]